MSGLGGVRGVRGAGDIQLQSASFPKRAGCWPLGLADAKNMFNLMRVLERVIKITHRASLFV